jgi:hypothetical protein
MSADVTAREANELAKQWANSDEGKKAARTLCNRYYVKLLSPSRSIHTNHVHMGVSVSVVIAVMYLCICTLLHLLMGSVLNLHLPCFASHNVHTC